MSTAVRPEAGARADMHQRPVLVVGGAGYIGSHTVRALAESDAPVVVLDNLSTGHAESITAPLIQGGLGDAELLADVFEEWRPRAVIHFAAKCYVGESMEHPALYYRENVVATYALLEAMRTAGCRSIVFSSTCATYGVPDTMPITEECIQTPINPYGRTKLHMEHMMQDYARAYGLRFAALRYFNAAGAAPDGSIGEHHDPETHLIPLLLQVGLGLREEILIYGDGYPTPDGTCIRDYIHVVDLADAHMRALAKLEAGASRIECNLGTGQGFSVLQVIDTVRRVTGHQIPARVVQRRPGDPPELVSGGSRARDLLGWEPRHSALEEIVADAWRFATTHPKGYTA